MRWPLYCGTIKKKLYPRQLKGTAHAVDVYINLTPFFSNLCGLIQLYRCSNIHVALKFSFLKNNGFSHKKFKKAHIQIV